MKKAAPSTEAVSSPKSPQISPQQFIAQLKQLVEQSYRDGLDRFLNWEVQGDSIVGKFQDGTRVFDFTLSKKGLEYKPASAQVTRDSLTELYPELKNRHPVYVDAWLSIRLDRAPASGGKKRECTSNTSYSCGASCINNKKACRISGNKINPQQIDSLIESARSLSGSGVNGAVPPPMPTTPPPMAGAMGKQGAITSGANVSQIPVPIYSQFRNNYRNNFENSAELAKQQAKAIEVEDIGDKTHVTFTVGGFSGDSKGGDRLKKAIKKAGFRNHHVVAISNEEFDVPPGVKPKADTPEFAQAAFGKMLNTTLNQGYNPVAVKVAAHAKAYADKYPNSTISYVGHSAGGIAAHEAAEISNKMGIEPQVAAIGSPWFGLTEPTAKSITIASDKDPVTMAGNVMKPNWVNSVNGHGIEDYFGDKESSKALKSFLGGTERTQTTRKRKDSNEHLPQLQKKPTLTPAFKSLLIQLKNLLEQVYTDGIDHFLSVKPSPDGNIEGVFRDGRKLLSFNIQGNNISYRLTPGLRSDSWLVGFGLELAKNQLEDNLRLDAPLTGRKKPNCKEGISCGAACIGKTKVCRINARNIANSNQLLRVKQTAITVAKEQAPPDKFESMSIRDLKKEASDRGVYRYSEMNTQQLKESIRYIDQNPDQMERLAETARRNKEGKTLRRFGVTGKGQSTKLPVYVGGVGNRTNPERSLAQSVRKWERIKKILKLADLDPGIAGAAVGAIVLGVSLQQYNKMRDYYRSGLVRSARAAEERASKSNVAYTPKSNITFTVGGFKEEGSSAVKLKDLLEAQGNKEEATASDTWWTKSNQIIPVETKEFQIGQIKASKRNKDGSYNPLYLAELSNKGFGAYLRNFRRGRNDDAVDLAAKIYAHANYRDPDKKSKNYGKYMNDKKSINILGHATGGNTVYEAMDILGRMQTPGARSGKEVLKRVNVVTLGTTDFGFTEKDLARERNITSAQDPFSLLPQRNEKWVSNVRGHEIEDYMKEPEVRDQLLQAFGYYHRSLYEYEQSLPRNRRN